MPSNVWVASDQVSWQLLFRLGMALERSKKWESAEKYFLKALGIGTESTFRAELPRL